MGLFFMAFFLLSFEDNETTKFLIKNAPALVINNADTARSILATLIGSIVSLTVFSFSMVMILLNQASSNFSPRLLPGLISNKKNQIVLGFYIGTIVFNIIILISILPDGDSYTLNGLSVLVGIVLGIICLALFVFFIHTISTAIQIKDILEKIFINTKERLLELNNQERQKGDFHEVGNKDWFVIQNDKSDYFQGVNMKGLLTSVDSLDINLKITAYKGQYVLPNMEIMRTDRKLDEKQVNSLKDLLVYSESSSVRNNYLLGFKQITEVGVKAMSPGINDPGTAVMTIDYLTELFALRMKLDEVEYYQTEEKAKNIELKSVDFQELIYQCLAAYRQYCKHDIILMEKIVLMLKYLLKQPMKKEHYKEVIKQQMAIVREDVELSVENPHDKQKILNLMDS